MDAPHHRKKQAAEFAHMLKELGYSSGAATRAQDWEWLFDYPSTRPFLGHLTSTLTRRNVLTTEEVSQWRSIPPKDYKTGAELEELLLCLENLDDDETKQEQEMQVLRNEVTAMEAELLHLQHQLAAVETKRGKMRTLTAQTKSQISALQSQEQERLEAIAKVEQQLAHEQDEMKGALSEVTKAVTAVFCELEDQLIEHSEEDKENHVDTANTPAHLPMGEPKAALHNIRLDDYLTLEKDLTTKIYEQMREMNQKSSCTEEGADNHAHRSVQRKMVHTELTAEMHRLKTVFAMSESKYVDALMELSRTRGSFTALQSFSAARYTSMPEVAVKQRICEVEAALTKINATIARHQQKTLPQLWRSLSALKALPVLHADYDAKLERQEKRGKLLDEAATILVGQEARYILVQAAIQQERENQRQVYGLLSSLLRELIDYNQALQTALSTRSDTGRTAARIASPDEHYLTTGERAKQLLSRDTISSHTQSGSDDPLQRLPCARAALQELQKTKEDMLQAIERQVREVSALVCSSESGDAQLNLTPLAVSENLHKLEETLHELQAAVDGVSQDHKMKLLALQHNAKEAAVERELFERFFTENYVPL